MTIQWLLLSAALFATSCSLAHVPKNGLTCDEAAIAAVLLSAYDNKESSLLRIDHIGKLIRPEFIEYLNKTSRWTKFKTAENNDDAHYWVFSVRSVEQWGDRYIYVRVELVAFLMQVNRAFILDRKTQLSISESVDLEWYEDIDRDEYLKSKKEPNQSLQPTTTAVIPAAEQPVRQP